MNSGHRVLSSFFDCAHPNIVIAGEFPKGITARSLLRLVMLARSGLEHMASTNVEVCALCLYAYFDWWSDV